MNQLLSPLCEHLLTEKNLPKAVAKAADAGPRGKLTSPCPLGPAPTPLLSRSLESGITPIYFLASALFLRGLGLPATSPQRSLSTEEEALAE